MAAIRFYRKTVAGLVFSLAMAATAATGLAANAPVLRRTPDGHLVPTGRAAQAPSERRARSAAIVGDRTGRGPMPRTPDGRPMLGEAAGAWRVLLIRVDFETDRLDALSSISTGGGFDLSPNGDSPIDPTPHDRAYFDAHMQGLANYYRLQSCGLVDVSWRILPEADDGAYHLTDVADYGPGENGNWTTENLVRFFQDAVKTCDADLAAGGYAERIGDYDAIIVAHAGPNLQTDVNYDTPNDIPSFYARLGDEDVFAVDGGLTIVRYGSVIPETAIQDGYYSGIAAVLAHEFGHQLGLPDLYNIETNAPTVGVWDNMDSGGMLGVWIDDGSGELFFAEGLIPGGLSAWSRTFLGWTAVDTVDTFAEGIALPAVEGCPARVARIEAGEDEYFLVENRAAEMDDYLTALVVDDETGVIIGTGNCLNCDDPSATEIEWELVNGYDILLPTESDIPSPTGGPGLLVWHIDDRLIAERWETNTVNTIFPWGVSLVEANGVVDLGDPYSYFALGWFDDAFYEGNGNEAMGDSILPPSWSNLLVPTGVQLGNVSARDTLMTFDAGVPALDRVERIMPAGRFAPAANGVLPLPGGEVLLADAAGDLRLAGFDDPVFSLGAGFVAPLSRVDDPATGGGAILAGTVGGTIDGPAAATLWLLDDRTFEPYEGWPVSIPGTGLAAPPVLLSTEAGIIAVVTTTSGHLLCYGADGFQTAGSPTDVGGPAAGNVVAVVDSLGRTPSFFTLHDVGPALITRWRIVVETVGGDPVPRLVGDLGGGYGYPVPLSAGEIEGGIEIVGGDVDTGEPGAELWVAAMETGRLFLCGRNEILATRDRETRIAAPPALHDLDGDGSLDLVYPDGERLCAVTAAGANLTGWPRRPASEYYVRGDNSIVSAPVVFSTADGPVVAAASELGVVYLFDGSGALLRGWPRRLAAGFAGGPRLVGASGGERMLGFLDLRNRALTDLAFPGAPGGCSVRWRRLPVAVLAESWAGAWGDAQRTSFARPATGGAVDPGEWLALDRDLIVYPNPSNGERVYFHFVAPADGEARLEIMTLQGEIVYEAARPTGGGEDEFVVAMSDRASGVYLCRLVLEADGRRTQAVKKFAIVH